MIPNEILNEIRFLPLRRFRCRNVRRVAQDYQLAQVDLRAETDRHVVLHIAFLGQAHCSSGNGLRT